MRLIKKFTIKDPLLTASNVDEDDADEWELAEVPYGLDDVVMVTSTTDGASKATHKIYKSTATANSEDPTLRTVYDDGDGNLIFWWIEVSSTNRWKMFDDIPQDQTENEDTITGTLALGSIIGAVAFINTDAETITVTMTDPTDGVVYDVTQAMQDFSNIFDYWDYFFSPLLRKTETVFYDLPPYSTADIDFTIDFTGSTAKCGGMVVGPYMEIGVSEYGANFGIKDYSQPIEDSAGRVRVERRDFSRTMDAPIVLAKGSERGVQRVFSDLLNTPTVFDLNPGDDAGIIYGYYTDFRVTYQTPAFTNCVVRIRGLIE
jgi:hypothetical protein